MNVSSSIVPFYIVNAIWVKGHYDDAPTMALRPDVARIDGNPRVKGIPDSNT